MQYVRKCEKRWLSEKDGELPSMAPTICFSRKIGAGAIEVADILAEEIGYRVADREIIEQIATDANLSQKTVDYFDERYPGKMNELAAMLFGEKSFIMSDYVRHLVCAMVTIADAEPTIFVGRGAHLILPRDSVLAVRLICSKSYRVKRLARILQVEEDIAAKEIEEVDKRQRDFFIKVFNKKDASPYEFDIVINCGHITQPHWVAKIILQAFKEKFEEFLSNIARRST